LCYADGQRDLSAVAQDLNTDPATLTQIVEALQQTLDYDMRDHMTKPLFKSSKTSIDSLKSGDIMTGVVSTLVVGGGERGMLVVKST